MTTATVPLNVNRFVAEAQYCAGLILNTLMQRGLHAELAFFLTERSGLVWLAVILNLIEMQGRLEGFVSAETLHHLSTALRGKKVFLSNSTGLRYMVLLTPAPTLPASVPFPEQIEQDGIPLGVGLSGPIILPVLRNTIVCGEPGSGKSNLLEGLLFSVFQRKAQIYLADPDGHTFNPDVFNVIAAAPVAQSPQDLLGLLEKLEAELLRRQALFRVAMRDSQVPADLNAYNQVTGQPLPFIILFVDEANSYFDHKAILEKLTDLARRGRKWGLILVLAAHNWRSKDVSRALSAMFPVRISFRVADDTTGAVVLGSHRWGKEAQRLRLPGRGILLADGQYRIFQAYRLSDEQANSLGGLAVESSALSELEQTLVRFALENLEGRFIVNRLAEALAEQGVTSHQVKTLAQRWEQRGWLTSPAHATDPRRVTPELAVLAGVPRTGAQAAQGRTGEAVFAQAIAQERTGAAMSIQIA